MKSQGHPSARWFHKLIAVFFVTMTVGFLSIPLALGRHPGEAPQKAVVAENTTTNLPHHCL